MGAVPPLNRQTENAALEKYDHVSAPPYDAALPVKFESVTITGP
jgi:hypothetical protein